MNELNEIESKKLEEYIVKTVHEDGHIEVNIDTKRMIDDLLGINSKNIRNKIIKVTFVKSVERTDPFGKFDETAIYLVNRTEDEIHKIFNDILSYEDNDRFNIDSIVKNTLRAYIIDEGKKYLEKTERGLTIINDARLIDGRYATEC